MSTPGDVPVAIRAATQDLSLHAERIRGVARGLLNGTEDQIPWQMFEATVTHAAAVVARQQAGKLVSEALSQAEAAHRAALLSGRSVEFDAAKFALDDARRDLAAAEFEERLLAVALDALRARVDLITAGIRRQQDLTITEHGNGATQTQARTEGETAGVPADSGIERPW